MAKEEEKVLRKEPNAVQRYYLETVGELRKVNWPTRREATNLTIVVLGVLVSMSLFLGAMDFLFNRFFAWILAL